jgi:hypothetical protein
MTLTSKYRNFATFYKRPQGVSHKSTREGRHYVMALGGDVELSTDIGTSNNLP